MASWPLPLSFRDVRGGATKNSGFRDLEGFGVWDFREPGEFRVQDLGNLRCRFSDSKLPWWVSGLGVSRFLWPRVCGLGVLSSQSAATLYHTSYPLSLHSGDV